MGVKSTVMLTRAEAEQRFIAAFVQARLRNVEWNWRMMASHMISGMDNVTLENELEELEDANHGGECFENYMIDGEPK